MSPERSRYLFALTGSQGGAHALSASLHGQRTDLTVLVRCRRCRALSPTPICDKCMPGEEARKKARWRERNAQSYYQTPEWKRLRWLCVRRDRECLICGSRHRLTANHIIPRREGGTDTLDNLMAMCGSCHSRYESDTRRDIRTELRTLVDKVRATLIKQRGLA